MDTAHRIVSERRRQLQIEGYTPSHDDLHLGGELLLAALAYLCIPGEEIWPWDRESFKPKDPVQNLVVAGALISAEGDRLIRRQEAGLPISTGLVVLGVDAQGAVDAVADLREISSEMKKVRMRL